MTLFPYANFVRFLQNSISPITWISLIHSQALTNNLCDKIILKNSI